MKTLFILRTSISTGSNIDHREILEDGKTETLTRTFDAPTRKRIKDVRNKYVDGIRRRTTSFYGLRICKQSVVPEIKQLVLQADVELKTVHADLKADAAFVPLLVDSVQTSELYTKLTASVKLQAFSELIAKLDSLSRTPMMTEAGRQSLLDLCKQIRLWNVVDDPEIERIVHDVSGKVLTDFGAIVKRMKGEIESLEKVRWEDDNTTSQTRPTP